MDLKINVRSYNVQKQILRALGIPVKAGLTAGRIMLKLRP